MIVLYSICGNASDNINLVTSFSDSDFDDTCIIKLDRCLGAQMHIKYSDD